MTYSLAPIMNVCVDKEKSGIDIKDTLQNKWTCIDLQASWSYLYFMYDS